MVKSEHIFSQILINNDYLILQWKANTDRLTDDMFKSEAVKFREVVEKCKPSGIIVDMRQFRFKLKPELIMWRNENIIPVYNQINLKKFAFISHQQSVSQSNPENTFETRTFTDMKQAKVWIKASP
jgi:hypothetical protein